MSKNISQDMNWSQYKLQLIQEVNNAKKMAEKEKEDL